MTRTSFCLSLGTYLRPVKNMPPPSKAKIHDHRPRLDQEFDERYPYLRSVNFNAQNTVLTAATRNKTKRHYREARKGKNIGSKRAPVEFRRSQAREVARLYLDLMHLWPNVYRSHLPLK